MELSIDQQKLLLDKMNILWRNKACLLCGGLKWSLTDKIYEVREFMGVNIMRGGSSIFPVIPVTCETCGNTHFLNPLAFGILVDQKNEEG